MCGWTEVVSRRLVEAVAASAHWPLMQSPSNIGRARCYVQHWTLRPTNPIGPRLIFLVLGLVKA